MQKAPNHKLYPISSCPDKIKIKHEAIAVTIIRKLLVELLCFGSIPNPEKAGFVIIPPPIPNEEETIPAIILIETTYDKFFLTLTITSDVKLGIKLFFYLYVHKLYQLNILQNIMLFRHKLKSKANKKKNIF